MANGARLELKDLFIALFRMKKLRRHHQRREREHFGSVGILYPVGPRFAFLRIELPEYGLYRSLELVRVHVSVHNERIFRRDKWLEVLWANDGDVVDKQVHCDGQEGGDCIPVEAKPKDPRARREKEKKGNRPFGLSDVLQRLNPRVKLSPTARFLLYLQRNVVRLAGKKPPLLYVSRARFDVPNNFCILCNVRKTP